jgi:hypothetical protein
MSGDSKNQIVVTNCVYNCLAEKCPKWVVLHNTIKGEDGKDKIVSYGRCADAIIALVLVEIKEALRAK